MNSVSFHSTFSLGCHVFFAYSNNTRGLGAPFPLFSSLVFSRIEFAVAYGLRAFV